MKLGTFLLGITIATSLGAQDDAPFLTVRSTDGANLIEWLNPATGSGLARVIGRLDRYPETPDDVDLVTLPFLVDVAGVPGEPSSLLHSGLVNGTTYYYTLFENDGADNYSSGRKVKGVPVASTGPIRWRFFSGTGATAMSPPGIGSVVLVLSNDDNVYPLVRGPDGGRWAPDAAPLQLQAPAQHRPAVIPASGITAAANVTFVASQDGLVRAVDADTGHVEWTSDPLGMLEAGPAAYLSVFSGRPENLVFVGTRIAGSANRFYALDASTGGVVWTFDDPGGPGIGIIAGGATVDYGRKTVTFASHEIAPGAPTVWSLDVVSGGKIWSTPLGDISGSPILRGGYFYVGADDGNIHALDASDGTEKLNFPFGTHDGVTKGFVFPNYSGNEVYLSTLTSVWGLRDVEPVVVKKWSQTAIPDPSIPVYPPGRQFLWVGSSDGRLYQIDVTSGNPTQPPTTTWIDVTGGTAGVGSPSFDLAYDLIYVGTEDGAVVAVEVPF